MDNEFFVPHGYLSDDEGQEDGEEPNDVMKLVDDTECSDTPVSHDNKVRKYENRDTNAPTSNIYPLWLTLPYLANSFIGSILSVSGYECAIMGKQGKKWIVFLLNLTCEKHYNALY